MTAPPTTKTDLQYVYALNCCSYSRIELVYHGTRRPRHDEHDMRGTTVQQSKLKLKNIARHKGAVGYGICGGVYIFWLFWTIGNAKIVTI